MTRTHAYIAFLLIAVLTLTGHSMAIARGAPGPSGFIELCTGTGPIMVAVDEDGAPTGASHVCPEFSLMLQDVLGGSGTIAVALEFRATKVCCDDDASLTSYGVRAATARGPPTLV